MPKIVYKSTKFTGKSRELILKANDVITEWKSLGYSLTLRQLYYQMVASDIIPNNDKEYKKLGDVLNNARLAGEIDWNAIEDRTRYMRENSHWENPAQIIGSAARSYAIDKWEGQEYRVFVMVEKDALIDIVQQAAGRLDVGCISCRGYMSQTEMWNMAQRLLACYKYHQQKPVILHLGDHDPSGIDMSRDIEDRLRMFTDGCCSDELFWDYDELVCLDSWEGFEFERIALNMDQIRMYNPPPNPAKITDSRSDSYIARHGRHSWELDALNPAVLDALITDKIEWYLDADLYKQMEEKQEAERTDLRKVTQHWHGKVAELLRSI